MTPNLKLLHKTLLILFFFQLTFALSQKIIKSNSFGLRSQSTIDYVGKDSNYVFFLSSKQNRTDQILLRFDKTTLELIDKRIIKVGHDEYIYRHHLIGDELLINTLILIKGQPKGRNCYGINIYTFNDLPHLKNKRLSDTINFQFSDSLNQSQIRLNSNTYKFNNTTYRNIRYDSINNKVFFTRHIIIPDEEIYHFKGYYDKLYLGLKTNTGRTREILLDENKKIVGYSIDQGTNNRYTIIGKYISKGTNSITYGVFQMILDENLNEIYKTYYLPLVKSSDVQTNDNSIFIFGNDPVKGWIRTPNNHIIFIYNKISISDNTVVSQTYQGGNSWSSKTEFVKELHCKNIYIINFSPEGSISTNTIYLDQRAIDHKKSTSFLCAFVDNEIVFTFYDHRMNLKKSINDPDVKTCYFTKPTILARCSYNYNDNNLKGKELIASGKELLFFYNFNDFENLFQFNNSQDWYFVGQKKPDSKKYFLSRLYF